jgi:hypothetical protein
MVVVEREVGCSQRPSCYSVVLDALVVTVVSGGEVL